jgi:hypothetical protein
LASIGSTGGAMAYNSLRRRVDICGRLLREALWAPIAIALAAIVLGRPIEAAHVWWLLHVLGGAAVAFCYLRGLRIGVPVLGALRPAGQYLFAFTAACSTALAWEIAEYMSDTLFGTALQEGLADTMSDLMLGVAGAAGYLALHASGGIRGQVRNYSDRSRGHES